MYLELNQKAHEYGPPPHPRPKTSLGKTSVLIAAIALILYMALNMAARGLAPYLLHNHSINPGELPSYLLKSAVVILVIAVVWIRFLAHPLAVAT